MADQQWPRRIAIIGSRTYRNVAAIQSYIESLPQSTIVITGAWPSRAGSYYVVEATQGVDREAYIAAEKCGLVTVLVSGSKTKRDNLAGLQRNPIVVELAEAAVAFWDMKSPGTGGTLRLFRDANKGVLVINDKGESVPHWQQFLPTR